MEYLPTRDEVPEMTRNVILTIHAQHATALYEGRKKFELRTYKPRHIPRKMFLYESDTKAITGYIVVDGVLSETPQALWEQVGELGAPRERFFRYFRGSKRGHAFKTLQSVRFPKPLPLDEIRAIEPGFRPPQTFLYLENLPKLQSVLLARYLDASLFFEDGDFQSKPLAEDKIDLFSDLVVKHIGSFYLESGREYAQKLVEIDRAAEDSEGVFTYAKRILEIYVSGEFIGFVVATVKHGGTMKTGPVILLEAYRARGFGKRLRTFLHAAARRAGLRKVYCTTPVQNAPAVRYLLESSYKVEAHLSRQYHTGHDEFVFGYVLADHRLAEQEIIRPINSFEHFALLEEYSPPAVTLFKEQFTPLYFQMPDQWFVNQVRSALPHPESEGPAFKPRVLFTASSSPATTLVDSDQLLQALALCLPKRGGSTKLLVLTRSAHQESLARFLKFIEQACVEGPLQGTRKLYAIVPLAETILIQAYWQRGFCSEGLLDRPYNAANDTVVLSKQIGGGDGVQDPGGGADRVRRR